VRIPNTHISTEAFRAYLGCYRAGDASALAPLVDGMLKSFACNARKWSRVAEFEDLVQESVCVFLEVLPKIRIDKGSSPVPYAMLLVRGKVRDYISRACSVARQHRVYKGKQRLVGVASSLGIATASIDRLIYPARGEAEALRPR
jgi:DNA-directed RNA polymerase specialized sigma subunit